MPPHNPSKIVWFIGYVIFTSHYVNSDITQLELDILEAAQSF